jgi:hypothetical protein
VMTSGRLDKMVSKPVASKKVLTGLQMGEPLTRRWTTLIPASRATELVDALDFSFSETRTSIVKPSLAPIALDPRNGFKIAISSKRVRQH